MQGYKGEKMKREDIELMMYDGKQRRIRVVLPDEYHETDMSYPVLFMFDGQNLFDVADSFAGTVWGVQDALEAQMLSDQAAPMIIIGIDNKSDGRLDEYGPWPFQSEQHSSNGGGKVFAEYFIKDLIPELENRFRISKSPKERFLAGSSMGALITAYIGTTYKDSFSSLGIFSISSWVSEKEFLDMLKTEGDFSNTRFFIQVGTEEVREEETGKVDYMESQKYIENTLNFIKAAAGRGACMERMSIHMGAGKTHNEAAWASYMDAFIKWLNGTE